MVESGRVNNHTDSKVHGANMAPIWGRQDPGGPHVGPWTLLSGQGSGILSSSSIFSEFRKHCLPTEYHFRRRHMSPELSHNFAISYMYMLWWCILYNFSCCISGDSLCFYQFRSGLPTVMYIWQSNHSGWRRPRGPGHWNILWIRHSRRYHHLWKFRHAGVYNRWFWT